MDEFVDVGRVSEFKDRRGRAVRVGDETVAVFRVDDRWFALRDACPHMGASLADGSVLGGRVQCAWHEWTFDLATGQSDKRAWACARVFETRVEGGRVLIRRSSELEADRPRDRRQEDLIEWDPERFFRKR